MFAFSNDVILSFKLAVYTINVCGFINRATQLC